MATWYLVRRYMEAPKAVEVTRATEHRVWTMEEVHSWKATPRQMKEVQRHRSSGGDVYYPTWAEAREHIVVRALKDHERKLAAYDDACRTLAEAEALPMDAPA